jgi:hypothetical protein
VRHNDCIGQLSQPWLHGRLLLKHIKACAVGAAGTAAMAAAAAAAATAVAAAAAAAEGKR